MLELLEPAVDAIVCTRNTSPRAYGRQRPRPTSLRTCSARRGSPSCRIMPDAIEAAVTLAETEVQGELSGVGVLITGSVVTVADARTLLVR